MGEVAEAEKESSWGKHGVGEEWGELGEMDNFLVVNQASQLQMMKDEKEDKINDSVRRVGSGEIQGNEISVMRKEIPEGGNSKYRAPRKN